MQYVGKYVICFGSYVICDKKKIHIREGSSLVSTFEQSNSYMVTCRCICVCDLIEDHNEAIALHGSTGHLILAWLICKLPIFPHLRYSHLFLVIFFSKYVG